jgi:XRE family aerobic/anaerobic benzoate catabolism transcriptional regulator
MDFAQQLGRRIRRARTERGMTQSELAHGARVGANYIPRLERGELVPSVEAAFRIARALGLSLDEMCGRTPARKEGPEVQDAIGRLEKTDAASLRRVADVIEALSLPTRKAPRKTK